MLILLVIVMVMIIRSNFSTTDKLVFLGMIFILRTILPDTQNMQNMRWGNVSSHPPRSYPPYIAPIS